MKKIILFGIGIFLLIGIAIAIGVGDILTQEQVNNINFDTINLQCSFDGFRIAIVEMSARFTFSCLSLQKLNETSYLIIRESWEEGYGIWDYINCRASNSKPVCLLQVRNSILENYRINKLALRERLKEFQNPSDFRSGDINFDEGELNE